MMRARGPGFLKAIVLAVLGAACSPPPDEAPGGGDPQLLHGEVEVRIVDHFDGTSTRRYGLLRAGAERLPLEFAQDPSLLPGTELAVWGQPLAGRLRVDRFSALALPRDEGSVATTAGALVGAPPFAKRKLAFVLVDLGGGVNITMDEAKRKAFGLAPGDQSMKQVVLEYSFGRQDLEGDVLGPIATTMAGCDEDALAKKLRPMVPAGYDNVVWYLGKRVAACDWAGIAPLGRVGKIAPELWVNGTASCRVATHEFGHNLGLQHAARLVCPGGAPMADDLSKCRFSEYGDSDDVMGDGCNHFNGYSKAYLTWFERCNGVQAGSSGTFTLLPLESACNGTQVLLVPMAKPRTIDGTMLANYALELRAPIGLDTKLGPSVLLRATAPVNLMRSARMTWIIDTKPATTVIDGLKQGETFTDPAGGVSFTVEALTPTSASVRVELAGAAMPNKCLDGTMFVAPGPATCGNFGEPLPGTSDGGAPVGGADAGAGGSPGAPDAGTPDVRQADAAASGQGGSSASGGPGGKSGSGGKSGGAGAGGQGGNGSGGAGGSEPEEDPEKAAKVEASGCGCRVGGGGAPSGWSAALLLGFLALAGRRRGRVLGLRHRKGRT